MSVPTNYKRIMFIVLLLIGVLIVVVNLRAMNTFSNPKIISIEQINEIQFDLKHKLESTIDQWHSSSFWYRELALDKKRSLQIQKEYYTPLTIDERNKLYPHSTICNQSTQEDMLNQYIHRFRSTNPHVTEEIKNPIIVDVVSVNDEWQMLLLRMHELKNVVHTFIFVECEYTFTNLNKPLHYYETFRHWEEFQAFQQQIYHHRCRIEQDEFPFVVYDKNGFYRYQ